MKERDEKVKELLRQSVAEYISRWSNRTSLITVTNVHLTRDYRRCDIFISVLPEHKMQAACDFANRHNTDLREEIKKRHRNLRRIPHFKFLPDLGEQNRQRIDELSWES